MLIKFIEMPGKQEVFFAASQIRCVMGAPENPLLSRIVTTLLTPQGFQSFDVLGGKAEIACMVNRALEGKNDLTQ
jgi:hypothetical protein